MNANTLDFSESLFGVVEKLFKDSTHLRVMYEIQQVPIASNVGAMQLSVFVFRHRGKAKMKDEI